jgi:hypothetical protein
LARAIDRKTFAKEAQKLLSYHSCWSVKPDNGQPGMPQADLLARLAEAFPVHKFDAEGARQGALRQLAALQAITDPVRIPEEILAYYRGAHPVDVTLADGPDADAAVLSFSVWPEPESDGVVERALVRFATEEDQRAGCVLLARVADALGWIAEDVTDEVE